MTRTISHLMPEPAEITNRVQFGQALTVLRERAGFTIRDIARSVDIPVATAGDYFTGRTLPPVKAAGVLLRVLRVCGITDSARIEEWRLALIRIRHNSVEQGVRCFSPYRGLVAYQPEDSGWLFGRNDLVHTLLIRLARCRAANVPLVVTGPAGAGKSSVLRAGLLPELSEHWQLMTPGRNPCRRLADRMCSALGIPADLADHALHGAPERIEILARARPWVLVIDQFEELFTVCREEWVAGTFLAALSALARSGVGVVVGSRDRADLNARWPSLPRDAASLAVPVSPMSTTLLRSAIESPARRARVVLEPGLVDVLVADATVASDPMPQLSQALLMTWRARENAVLTRRAYRMAGGVDAAVRHSVRLVFAGFTERQRELASGLLDGLRTGPVVQPNPTHELDAVVDGFVLAGLLARDGELLKATQSVALRALLEK